jgi:peptidoglycan/xylan/chitin deacetylase (PgdA/CDA1 family)
LGEPALLSRVDGVEGRFAITFDDGPSPTWTPRVLDVLAAAGARATFFPLAPNLRRHGALAARAVAEGHELGVHGEWHLPPPLVPWAVVRLEIACGVAAATAITGRAPRWWRPPFGVVRAGQSRRVRALGLLPVEGDVYPRDVERPGVEVIVERALARLRPGSILVLHDASGLGDFDRSQSVAAAARILERAAACGLAAVSLSELLASPGARPDAAWAVGGA